MNKPDEKLPRIMLIAPVALILCCLGSAIFLLITTGTIVAYLNKNKVSLLIFVILLASIIYFLIKHRHKIKGSC
jgi:hypothetical protein